MHSCFVCRPPSLPKTGSFQTTGSHFLKVRWIAPSYSYLNHAGYVSIQSSFSVETHPLGTCCGNSRVRTVETRIFSRVFTTSSVSHLSAFEFMPFCNLVLMQRTKPSHCTTNCSRTRLSKWARLCPSPRGTRSSSTGRRFLPCHCV